MREFTQTINLKKQSLRPETRIRRTDLMLTEAFGLVSREWGLEPQELASDPFVGGEAVAWPFPQLVRMQDISLLLGETNVKEVDESGTPWTASAVTTYDALDRDATKAIVADGCWHIADLGSAWMLFNGTSVVFRTGMDYLSGVNVKTYVQDQVQVTTGCAHKGRIICGGFTAGSFWPPEWRALFNEWAEFGGFPDPDVIDDVGESWILWSSIGGGDFPLWLFFPDWHWREFGPSRERVINQIKRNEFGWMPMHFQGRVQKILPLGAHAVVYGEGGVDAVYPATGREVDMPPILGHELLLGVGIAGREAVGGDDSGHVFVDGGGDLWSVVGGRVPEVRRLGFKEFIFPMLGGTIQVLKHPQLPRFFVTDGSECFVLEEGRLTESKQRPTSLEWADGGLVGLFTNAADDEARVVTSPFDLNYRGIKVITRINLGLDVGSSDVVEVAIDYRYDKGSAFTRSAFKPVDKEGNAFNRIAGVEFQVVVKSSDFSGFYLDYITVNYQIHDKRVLRGVDASQAFPRTG